MTEKRTTHPKRRSSDNTALTQLRHVLIDGDISMVLLLGGLGLIMWAVFGVYLYTGDLEAYAKLFPIGNGAFWVGNYIACGLAMWYLVAKQFPPVSSLLIGAWVSTIWTWSALARMTTTAVTPLSLQIGNATTVVYIIIGLLIIHRSARK